MREFHYTGLAKKLWDTETLNFTNLIHEFKGKQDLYVRQKPVELNRLVEIAKIQSTESSNRIEGIVTTASRIQAIVKEKTPPRNRDEFEIAGYRDVLNTIHENHDYIPIRGNYILQLHRDLMQYTGSNLGGIYKITQNYLKENAEQVKAIVEKNAAAASAFTVFMETEPEALVSNIAESLSNKAEATKNTAATAAEATKDVAAEAVNKTVENTKAAVNQKVEDAKAAANQKAEETKAAAKQKANEAVDNAAQNVKKGLGL